MIFMADKLNSFHVYYLIGLPEEATKQILQKKNTQGYKKFEFVAQNKKKFKNCNLGKINIRTTKPRYPG